LLGSGHVIGIRAIIQIGRKTIHVQVQLAGQRDEEVPRRRLIQPAPRFLALEQEIVVLPEPALGARGFGRLGRLLRVGVNTVERKMPVDYLYIIGVSVCQTL
jgi:hypothetical protein